MNFSVERPWVLYGILLAVPPLVYCAFVYQKTFSLLMREAKRKKTDEFKEMKKRVVWRIALRAAAWCMLTLAAAGISWGTVSSPAQKSGSAVSLVFDISYSMTARDCPGNLTRLEAAASYALALLDKAPGIPASAVLAKGNGIVAVPLTEDAESLRALIGALSPKMMSSAGSSLGEGINAALKSFPKNISKAPVIWLFTDGEESDSALEGALTAALRRGANVVIIGFGEEREMEIYAGDGETRVKTALRAKKMREAADSANKRTLGGQGFNFIKGAEAKFAAASEPGSALKALAPLKAQASDKITMAYETQQVDRHSLFIALGIAFFILSFFASEFSPRGWKEAFAISLAALCLSSCSSEFNESKKIFTAVWNWNQKKYDEAVAGFTKSLDEAKSEGNETIKQYALYGLSATYLMQNENAAALEKINELSGSAPSKIKFAAFYNSGIIAQREGDWQKAAESFKNALLVDPANVRAKINLELSYGQQAQLAKESERQLDAASEMSQEESDLQKSVFNRIREKDQQQWKNTQSAQERSSPLDY